MVGGACMADGDCCAPAFCDDTGVCAVCQPDGTACQAHSECCTGYCDPATSMCGVTDMCLQIGEACTSNGECCPGLGCINGVCDRLCLSLGEMCTFDGDCCSGYCNPTTGVCDQMTMGCSSLGRRVHRSRRVLRTAALPRFRLPRAVT